MLSASLPRLPALPVRDNVTFYFGFPIFPGSPHFRVFSSRTLLCFFFFFFPLSFLSPGLPDGSKAFATQFPFRQFFEIGIQTFNSDSFENHPATPVLWSRSIRFPPLSSLPCFRFFSFGAPF